MPVGLVEGVADVRADIDSICAARLEVSLHFLMQQKAPEGMIRKMTWFWSSDFFKICSCGGLEADSKWRCAYGHVTNVLGPFNVRAGWFH